MEYFNIEKVVFLVTDKTKQYVENVEGLKSEIITVSPSSYSENLKLKLDCDAIDITGGTKQMASAFSIIAARDKKGVSYLEGPGYFKSAYPEVPRWLQKFESYNMNFKFSRPYVKDLPKTLPSINKFSSRHDFLSALSIVVNYFDEADLSLQFIREGVSMNNFTIHLDDEANFQEAKKMGKILKDLNKGSSIDQLETMVGLKSVKFKGTEDKLRGKSLLPDTNFFYDVDAYRLLNDEEPIIYVSDCLRNELSRKVNPDLNLTKEPPNLNVRMHACLAYHQYLSLISLGRSLPIESKETYCDNLIVEEYLKHLHTKMYLVSRDNDVIQRVNNWRLEKPLNPPLSYDCPESKYERSLGTYSLFKMIGMIIYSSRGEVKAIIGGKREGKYVEVEIELSESIRDRNLRCDLLYGRMFNVNIVM